MTGRGNLAGSHTYDVANRLVSTTAGLTLSYDAMSRLKVMTSAGNAYHNLYDGMDMIGEYNAGGGLVRRYVHGPAYDEPLVMYDGSGTGKKYWYAADERGSIIAYVDATGAAVDTITYDEYGRTSDTNGAGYQYTGQIWLKRADAYHYKARAYSPNIGRFLQPDPIGYDDGMNMYAYVRNDPVNWVDPMGLKGTRGCGGPGEPVCGPEDNGDLIVQGRCEPPACYRGGIEILMAQRVWVLNVDRRGLGSGSGGGGGPGESAPPGTCPAVPLAPPGASVDQNMRDTARMGVFDFFKKVRNRGAWDYKQQGSQYQDFGNFNYGATAASQGSFPTDVIGRAAGWAQERAGTSKSTWGDPLGAAPFGDDPADQKMIQAGIQYRRLGRMGK